MPINYYVQNFFKGNVTQVCKKMPIRPNIKRYNNRYSYLTSKEHKVSVRGLIRRSDESWYAVVKNEKEPDPNEQNAIGLERKRKRGETKGPGQNLGMPKFLACCQCLVILL